MEGKAFSAKLRLSGVLPLVALHIFVALLLGACASSQPSAGGGTPEWTSAQTPSDVAGAAGGHQAASGDELRYRVELRRISGAFAAVQPTVSRFQALYWTASFLRQAAIPELPTPQDLSILARLFFMERPENPQNFSGAYQEVQILPYSFSGQGLLVQNQFFVLDAVDSASSSASVEYPIGVFYLLTNVPLAEDGSILAREVRPEAELGPGRAWFGQYLLFEGGRVLPLDWWALVSNENSALLDTARPTLASAALAPWLFAADSELTTPETGSDSRVWFIYFARIAALESAAETLQNMEEVDRLWYELVLQALELE